MDFTRAIVRPPARNFADGLTTVDLGVPDVDRAIEQHHAYCVALENAGLVLIRLDADDRYPDSTFVEDTALLFPEFAILTHPGAESRKGEVAAAGETIREQFAFVETILEGTVDGGDICETGSHVLIGVSHRTSEEGAKQLAAILHRQGYSSSVIDVRSIDSILHLKSGISYVGEGRMITIPELAAHPELQQYERLIVDREEAYAANAVRVNDHVLIAEGFPRLQSQLETLGYECIPLAMSEFQKMDGGLSCLSLRF
jgi:dimethylargininase